MHGTLLHHYAGRGRVPYLKLLLRYVPQGAVDAQENMRGMTPLHLAAQRGKVPVCSLLLASGAEATAPLVALVKEIAVAIKELRAL